MSLGIAELRQAAWALPVLLVLGADAISCRYASYHAVLAIQAALQGTSPLLWSMGEW